MQEQAKMQRRTATRQRLELSGSISRGEEPPIPCAIVDMSILGASITSEDYALPNVFTLFLDQPGAVQRKCEVVWRTGFTVGVRFMAWRPKG
jgi:hypothetical protein